MQFPLLRHTAKVIATGSAIFIFACHCSRPAEDSKPNGAQAPQPPRRLVERQLLGERPQAATTAAPQGKSTAAEERSACAQLREGEQYVSTEELVCGPPVDDHPAPRCRSRITFSGGRYQWRHTDMVFIGEYHCEGLRIIGEEHSGRYEPATGRLYWEGLEYEPVK